MITRKTYPQLVESLVLSWVARKTSTGILSGMLNIVGLVQGVLACEPDYSLSQPLTVWWRLPSGYVLYVDFSKLETAFGRVEVQVSNGMYRYVTDVVGFSSNPKHSASLSSVDELMDYLTEALVFDD